MKKMKLIIISILLLLLSPIIASCGKPNTTELNVDALKSLSRLNTLECTFKTAAEIEDRAILNKIGTIRYFIQYNVTFVIGIDMNEIEYDEVKKTLSIPKAKVTIRNYGKIDQKGKDFFWFKLDKKSRDRLLKKSIDELEENLKNNDHLLRQGQQLAKSQISSLVNQMYTISGKKPNLKYILE